MYVHSENQLGFVGYDVGIVGYDVCQYGMMLVSQGIVGYDMVYITHACMTQCYGILLVCYVMVCYCMLVWYDVSVIG